MSLSCCCRPPPLPAPRARVILKNRELQHLIFSLLRPVLGPRTTPDAALTPVRGRRTGTSTPGAISSNYMRGELLAGRGSGTKPHNRRPKPGGGHYAGGDGRLPNYAKHSTIKIQISHMPHAFVLGPGAPSPFPLSPQEIGRLETLKVVCRNRREGTREAPLLLHFPACAIKNQPLKTTASPHKTPVSISPVPGKNRKTRNPLSMSKST